VNLLWEDMLVSGPGFLVLLMVVVVPGVLGLWKPLPGVWYNSML
jgi:hypothetical protein